MLSVEKLGFPLLFCLNIVKQSTVLDISLTIIALQ